MGQARDKLQEFLSGLDSGDKDRLKDAATTAFNEYVEDAPGYDPISRPVIAAAIKKAIDDYCGGT